MFEAVAEATGEVPGARAGLTDAPDGQVAVAVLPVEKDHAAGRARIDEQLVAAGDAGGRRARDEPGAAAGAVRDHFFRPSIGAVLSDVDSAAMKASCGTSTRPTIFIRFLPSFCFSSSLRLRVMSPP